MHVSRCLVPGSFDPVTNGHMDIIRRAAALFDEVTVGVLHNPEKAGYFPVPKRVEMLEKACAGLKNVRIIAYGGLLARLTRETGIRVVVRGVRGVQDLESETAMARINGTLDPGLETVFLPAFPGFEQVSASMVRQILLFGGDPAAFVPPEVLEDIMAGFAK